MPDYVQQSQDAITTYQDTLATIRARTDLNDSGRRQRIAAAYDTARAAVDHAHEKHQWTKRTQRQKLERKVFGPATTKLTGADAISWRDAQDRAAKLIPTSFADAPDNDTLEAEALELLNRALQSGDDHLARAVMTVAFDMRWADVANTYAEASDHPDDVADLWNSATNEGTGIDVEEWNFILDSPKELAVPEQQAPHTPDQQRAHQAALGRQFADAINAGAADITGHLGGEPGFGNKPASVNN
jgi:hypothetical protein